LCILGILRQGILYQGPFRTGKVCISCWKHHRPRKWVVLRTFRSFLWWLVLSSQQIEYVYTLLRTFLQQEEIFHNQYSISLFPYHLLLSSIYVKIPWKRSIIQSTPYPYSPSVYWKNHPNTISSENPSFT